MSENQDMTAQLLQLLREERFDEFADTVYLSDLDTETKLQWLNLTKTHPAYIAELMENFDISLCSHKSTNGDNYGTSCAICNSQLTGYGFGGWFGTRLTGFEICLHGQFVKVESGENEYCAFCGKSKEQIEQLKIIESEAVN